MSHFVLPIETSFFVVVFLPGFAGSPQYISFRAALCGRHYNFSHARCAACKICFVLEMTIFGGVRRWPGGRGSGVGHGELEWNRCPASGSLSILGWLCWAGGHKSCQLLEMLFVLGALLGVFQATFNAKGFFLL